MVTLRGALLLALTATLGCAGGGSSTDPAPAGGADRARTRRGGVSDASLDLEAMLAPVPEYAGQGRNLFAYGPVRVEATPPPPLVEQIEAPPVVAPPSTPLTEIARRAPAPPTRINVKYAGFLEKTNLNGAKAKYAIFLDGNEILAGAEGETVANRFTIVEIGLESVTVSAQGSNATERIPLQSN